MLQYVLFNSRLAFMNNLEVSLARIKANIEKRTANKNTLANADPSHDLVDNTITKSNALSRAYYRFGLVEKRCMEALVSKLNPMRNDNIQDIELRAVDYAKAFGVSEKHAYEHLTSAADALLNRVIVINEDNGKIRKMTLTAQAVYEEKAGKVTVTFNPLIVPHLIGLRGKFSSYPLKEAVNFTSSYTWRFYELLVSWAQKTEDTGGIFAGWFTPSVEDLRQMLGAPDSYTWNMFERRVLDVIKAELLEKSNIQINITRQKTGRKITHLKIEFIEHQEKALNRDQNTVDCVNDL
jgi:plasmid replication initiation protein